MNVLENLKPILRRMPLYVRLMYMLYSDPAISRRRKAYLSASLLYIISPIDLIPGFIPVLGQLDDIIVALSALLRELKRLPSDKRNEYLGRVNLQIGTIESDLDAAKWLTVYLATNPVTYVGRGLRWTGKKAGRLMTGCYSWIRDRRRPKK